MRHGAIVAATYGVTLQLDQFDLKDMELRLVVFV
jgi:hypothetical protein